MGDEDKVTQNIRFEILKRVLPLLIVGVLAGGSVYFIAREKPQVLGLARSSDQNQAEVNRLITELDKLISLPKDEQPTVATVTDIEKVKEQQFFKNAQNGDKVLIYSNTRRVILYRPSEKRIIEVGTVNINRASPSPTPEGEEEVAQEPSPTPEPEETQAPEE